MRKKEEAQYSPLYSQFLEEALNIMVDLDSREKRKGEQDGITATDRRAAGYLVLLHQRKKSN